MCAHRTDAPTPAHRCCPLAPFITELREQDSERAEPSGPVLTEFHFFFPLGTAKAASAGTLRATRSAGASWSVFFPSMFLMVTCQAQPEALTLDLLNFVLSPRVGEAFAI